MVVLLEHQLIPSWFLWIIAISFPLSCLLLNSVLSLSLIIIIIISPGNTDKLPRGAYCSFQEDSLEACGWRNSHPEYDSLTPLSPSTPDKPSEKPQWIRRLSPDGMMTATANFIQGHSYPDRAGLRSEDFPSIPYYHSLPESQLYKSCLVSVSWHQIMIHLIPSLFTDGNIFLSLVSLVSVCFEQHVFFDTNIVNQSTMILDNKTTTDSLLISNVHSIISLNPEVRSYSFDWKEESGKRRSWVVSLLR